MKGFVQRSKCVSVYAALIALCVGASVMRLCDAAAADLTPCPTALANLLPCLPYSQGTAKVPTKECCTNLLDVHLHQPQCLCELVAGSVKGTPGIPKINTTLSLMLGPSCKVGTNPAVCPGLLGLSPNDPVAKIFTSAAANSTATNSTTPAASGNSTTTTPSPNSNDAAPVFISLEVGFALAFAVYVSLF